MSLTSSDLNALIYRYLVEAGQNSGSSCFDMPLTSLRPLLLTGFQHASYVFNSESHVKREMPDLHTVPPGALIKFVSKGVLYAEMEANLKEVAHKRFFHDCILLDLLRTILSMRLQLCRTALLLKTTTSSSVLLKSS